MKIILMRMAKEVPLQKTAPITRWGQDRRLEFIDFRLLWEGRVNRSDLTSYFGISIPQASADLTKYQELAPSNLVYDKQVKAYVAAPSFHPVIESLNAYSFLNAIRQVDGQMLAMDATFLGWMPPYWVIRTPSRHVDVSTLRSSLHAIRTNTQLLIEYQSKNRPLPSRRFISPHALAFDGIRWHLRAYCFEHADFRDFVISRMTLAETTSEPGFDPTGDASWNSEVSVIIEPSPGITEGHRRTIELDYGMIDGRSELRVREAMLLYLLRQLPLRRGDSGTWKEPLVLVNFAELQPTLDRVGFVF